LAQAIGETLEGKYPDKVIKILKCFLDPKNHAIEMSEPSIDYDFSPDTQHYPQASESECCDSVYELFTVHDGDGKPLCKEYEDEHRLQNWHQATTIILTTGFDHTH
jgi:hypothetical protein